MSEGAPTPSGSSNLDSYKVEGLPAAFADIGKKHNLLVSLLSAMKGEAGIEVMISEGNIIIQLKDKGGGGGLPPGYTFTEFTGCDSGTSFTYWIPIWDTNPEA